MHLKRTCCCLPAPLGQSFAGPGLSGSLIIPFVLLLFCTGFFGTAFVFLGSRLLWVLPDPCVFLLFCPGFSGTALASLRFQLLWVPAPLLCAFVLYCPGFCGTFFRWSWLIWVPSPLFSRCMVWVILMHRLTAWP